MTGHETAGGALAKVAWHISTRSGNGDGNCVEAGPVLDGSGQVAVRDSKDRAGAVMIYSAAEWSAFVTALKAGQLNLPA